jgi:hypothetical protein
MHIEPKMTVYEPLFPRISTMFTGKRFVHTEGVTGSIPVTPTISNHCNVCIFLTFRSIFTKWSTGLAKPHPQKERADLVLVTPPRP